MKGTKVNVFKGAKTYLAAKKNGRELICVFFNSSGADVLTLGFDLCYTRLGPKDDHWVRAFLGKLIKSSLPKEFMQERIIDNRLPKVKMPGGFGFVATENQRHFFVDSSGLVESEVFFQKVGPLHMSKAGIAVFNKSVINSLRKSKMTYKNKISKQATHCLFLQGGLSIGSNFCYSFVQYQKSFKRVIFVTRYPLRFIDSKNLGSFQMNVLAQWNQQSSSQKKK